ncbi:MAG: GNAT family N-acetyltransferase/peptidase C39 family protein [Gammaproteobacteria bacterium]|nr:GNAT family N-acetyltransferase/peptidase C39 family protein [Gammaproteobacteria bacterium]
MSNKNITIQPATLTHLDTLLNLEQQCFSTDRLSRRSMRRFLSSDQSVFLLAVCDGECVGYLLTIFHRGTRLARLYSIAVGPQWQSQGIARKLMLAGEEEAQLRGAFYFRLEVSHKNTIAIQFYHSLGFTEFGYLQDYYDDHSDALRMQKRIRYHNQSSINTIIPWYQQTTPFTCGPASLMMAMAGLSSTYQSSLSEELQIWREATTIYMTSGHGGCHPIGLALAARRRGFNAEVWINQQQPLFVEGVRSEAKKRLIETVHNDFVAQSKAEGITIHHENINQSMLISASLSGAIPIMLISTYRMDRKKTPHWVTVSGYDDKCLYVHDPDPDEKHQDLLDCQYLPIAREDFDPMSSFGSNRLRTAVIISAG